MEQTKDELRALGYENLDNLENSEDEQSSAGGGDDDTHIGDDICLDDLTGKVYLHFSVNIFIDTKIQLISEKVLLEHLLQNAEESILFTF